MLRLVAAQILGAEPGAVRNPCVDPAKSWTATDLPQEEGVLGFDKLTESPEDQVIRRDYIIWVLAKAGLETKDRRLLLMMAEGFTLRAIAERMGMTPNQVAVRLCRARRRVKSARG